MYAQKTAADGNQAREIQAQALEPVPEVLPLPVVESPRQEVRAPSSIKERLCFLIAEMN